MLESLTRHESRSHGARLSPGLTYPEYEPLVALCPRYSFEQNTPSNSYSDHRMFAKSTTEACASIPAQAGILSSSPRSGAFWHACGALLLDPALMRMTSRLFGAKNAPQNLCKVCALGAQTQHNMVLRQHKLRTNNERSRLWAGFVSSSCCFAPACVEFVLCLHKLDEGDSTL